MANKYQYSAYSIFKNMDSMYLVSTPKTIDGTSGSPVFFKYHKKRKDWIEFAGVMVATDSTSNCSVLLKKEFVLKAFEKYKNLLTN